MLDKARAKQSIINHFKKAFKIFELKLGEEIVRNIVQEKVDALEILDDDTLEDDSRLIAEVCKIDKECRQKLIGLIWRSQ